MSGPATGATATTTVWLSPSATSFACLCEPCLETARTSGALFAEALRTASVRGRVSADAPVAIVRCAADHEVVLRRVERPPRLSLSNHGERQLQLT